MNYDLLAEKITPATVIDVGCHKGHWHNEARLRWPNAHFILIDANPANLEAIQATGAEHYIAALSDCEKEVTFYTRKDDQSGCTGDSLFKELTPWYDDPVETTVTTTTLDTLLGNAVRTSPILVKIDCQGAELDILKGAKWFLPLIEALVLEVSLKQYNEGSPLIGEVETFLTQQGFRWAATLEEIVHPITREKVQEDRLYLRA